MNESKLMRDPLRRMEVDPQNAAAKKYFYPMCDGVESDQPGSCRKCGMEIQVTAPCGCKDEEHLHFQCCGQELTKV